MRIIRNLLAAMATCCATLSLGATATTDFTDLWFPPNEAGWGANVLQQNDILFVTLFVSNQSNAPIWYVASNVVLTSTSNGTFVFSGPLYQATAPYFGGPFNPANVSLRQVGTLTFTTSQISSAVLTYSVDGVNVIKQISRFAFKNENVAGSYLGATTGTWSSCGSARNGYQENPIALTVSQDGVAITMREDGPNYTCTYSGNYSQTGHMGIITGNSTCSDGINQSFTATEVVGGVNYLTMRLSAQQIQGQCVFTGRMGGMRRSP